MWGSPHRLAGLVPVIAACVAVMLLGSAALAQEEPTEPRRIGVFGDSLADGLWIGLQRGLRRDARAGEIEQLSEVATGLANYVYRDISEKTRGQLEQGRYDVAVVMFGSNDIQGIRTDRGVFRFRSAGWEEVYRERIRDLITQLQAHGAEVYWTGLPVMRSTGYDANTVYLNAIFREEAEALGAIFVSTREASSDENGEYAAYLPNSRGAPRLMRDDDGIHFTMNGYARIAAPVVEAIQAGWDNPRPRPAPALTETVMAEAVVEASEPEPQGLPAGWLDLSVNGQAYVCQPVGLDGQPLGASTASGAAGN